MNLEVIEAVALRALRYDYRMWGFGEGMALLGILRAATVLDRPEWIDAVRDLVEPTLKTESGPADHLIPLEVLAALDPDLVKRSGRADANGRLDRGGSRHLADRSELAGHADMTQRFLDAATMGPHRPDLPGLDTTIWVDCMHTDGPGFMLAGRPDAAAQAVRLACHRLQDDSGMFSHGYDVVKNKANGVHWGRGQGWALHGLISVGSPQAHVVLEAMSRHEEDGRWRTIVDDPAAPLENSVSALVAGAIFELGTSSRYPLGKRALQAAIAELDQDGGLPVSAATPVGSYLDRETGVFPWGQGPLLIACLAEKS